MNSNPQPGPGDRTDSVLRRIAEFVHPDYKQSFWSFIIDFAERLKPADTLLRIIEGLGYMVLSLHAVPQRLTAEREKFEAAIEEANEQRTQLRGELDRFTKNYATLLREATKAMLAEPLRYVQSFDAGIARMGGQIDEKLGTLPKAVANALVAATVKEIQGRTQALKSYRALIYAGTGTVIFVIGCLIGHLL